MHNYLKVVGHDSLVRDVNTHAIINTNSNEYNNFIKKQQAAENQDKLLSQHSEDINTIKEELNEIKNLLLLSIKQRN